MDGHTTSDSAPAQDLARAILSFGPIEECAVISRTAPDGGERYVAYVVASGHVDADQLRQHLQAQTVAPVDSWTRVASIPRNAEGAVDEKRLGEVPVIDADLLNAWQEKVSAQPGVREAAVVVEPYRPRVPAVHVAELFPDWRRSAMAGKHDASGSDAHAKDVNGPQSDRLSISEGPAVDIPAGAPSVLGDVLARAARGSKTIAYVSASGAEESQTYADLQSEATRILTGLQAAGCVPGDRVILQLGDARDFIPVFWACVLGGFLPVPVGIAPSYVQVNATLAKLRHAWELLGRPIVVTTAPLAGSITALGSDSEEWSVATVESLRKFPGTPALHACAADDPALMLLTSGSTGAPKVVVQTHRALVTRSLASCVRDGFSSDDVSLNWLPLDHVGGLVAYHIRDMYAECDQVQAPMSYVVEQPLRWLDLIHRYRATTTWAPNFAFALVNAQAPAVATGNWDLSSMRFIMNGAEAIVARTARRFLEILEPHGLPADSMRPAWGMSETSSGATSSHLFSRATTTDDDASVEVGPPIAGISFRIVDVSDQLVPEGQIGRLQARGELVTKGYYHHESANRESYTSDGWFITGDLGRLRDGCLTITGREKDVIIVNAVNYLCQDIEAWTELVPGVDVSFTAACAVRMGGSDTDELAIIFHPTVTGDRALQGVLTEIRRKIVTELGVNPSYLVPVGRSAIPKTEIGKIQRSQLRDRLERGHFERELRAADVLLETAETLPDWFVAPVWRRENTDATDSRRGPVIVITGSDGSGTELAHALRAQGHTVVTARAGHDDYARVFGSRDERIRDVVYAGTWGARAGGIPSSTSVQAAMQHGIDDLLALAHALHDDDGSEDRRLIVAASDAQQVMAGEPIACGRVAVIGLLQSLGAEHPHLRCTHVDLSGTDAQAAARGLSHELSGGRGFEVAYRRGQRWVKRLAPVDLRSAAPLRAAFGADGFYVITGGLGGVGRAIAEDAIVNGRARLLLVGRRPLSALADEFQSLQALATEPSAVRYARVDVTDAAAVKAVVAEAAAAWKQPLKGIAHLAGAYHDQSVVDETADTIAAVLAPKVAGTCALHEVLADTPDAWFVGFSSALSYFGGAMVGAYAAANRFLESVSLEARRQGRQSMSVAWSTWDQMGMSRGHAGVTALRGRGFREMSAVQATRSLRALIERDRNQVIVGLDRRHDFIRRQLVDGPLQVEQVTAYTATDDPGMVEAAVEAMRVTDKWRTAVTCEVTPVRALPRSGDGTVDQSRLRPSGSSREHVAPATEWEQQVAAIWQDVLGGKPPSVDDHFFEAGGHSLLAMQVLARIKARWNIDLPLRVLFELPTVRGLALRLEQETTAHAAPGAAALVALPRTDTLPLTFAQQRFWFVDQLEPNSSSYNIPSAYRLRGPLDVDALEASLRAIVDRHETLRTTFPSVDGRPLQVIGPADRFALRRVRADGASEDEREKSARAIAAAEGRQPFDLAHGPLIRAVLVQLDARTSWLLVTLHHIIADGWSLGVFARELSGVYNARIEQRPFALEPLAIQFADYAAWQRRALSGAWLDEQLAYWTAELSGVPTVLAMPTDRPRPAVQTSNGSHRTFRLPADLIKGVESLAAAEGATPFMAILAAFEVLLHRYTAQDEFIVSTAVANRDRSETEALIGCLINVVLMHADVSGNPSFRALLNRVRAKSLSAFAHQDLPFEKLVEALHPERDLSYNPLAQAMFVYLPTAPTGLSLSGLAVEAVDVEDVATPYDLQLHVWPHDGELAGFLHYNTDLFEDATIDRLLAHLRAVLERSVAEPDAAIRSLALLGGAEKRQLLTEWNATQQAYPSDASLADLIDAQARRTPAACAVSCAGQSLSYDELRTRSNQLAHRLQREGIGPDVLVGVCLERSVDLVIGLLGILKAGGAYVPLDPSYPRERLQLMLDDSGAPVLLTSVPLKDVVGAERVKTICIDRDWLEIARESVEAPVVHAGPERLAYVIYTSGSTGVPKGVEIPHRAVVNFLCSMQKSPGISPDDRLLAVTTLSFDIAGLEIYLPLITGARVVLATREVAVDAFALMRTLVEEGVTIMQATPATWQALIQVGWKGDGRLKVLVGGEAVPRKLADDLVDRVGEVWNMYGPTETTIWSTVHRLERGQTIVSIGQPIANTTCYVLDADLRPTPIGVPGELHIGGDGLARGYRNRPDLTAEKFVASPFGTAAGSRIYKTGDLVRYRPDGTIEFFGRLDHQVKVHGHRIELGEIESVLLRYAGVGEAVVIVREDTPGDKRLVGYVSAADDTRFTVHALQQHVKEHLPAYMVPSGFVQLDALPRTLNGKIDRKHLPKPSQDRLDVGDTFVAPRNEIEESLADIWRTVIGVARVGVRDDFFALGGHSLLATQVLALVNAHWQVDLPLRALFEEPTVEGLAARLTAAGGTRSEPALVPVSTTGPLPLSFPQQRLWFVDQLEPGSSSYNLRCGFWIRGPLDVAALERGLATIVARHESLRTRFPSVDGRPAQVIAPAGEIRLNHIDLSTLADADRDGEARRRAHDEAQAPFDLAVGPLLRTTLVRLEPTRHLLLVTMHHIVADGWSIEVFMRELQALYGAYRAGMPSPLAPLAIQYSDFAIWQRNVMQGERLQSEVDFWKDHLAGLPTLVTLPTDRPRPPVQSSRGREYRFTLPRDLTEDLKRVSRQEGLTLFMTLMTAFEILLHRYGGQEQFIVSTGVANRTRPELEPIIGCLINVLLMKADLAGNPTISEALQRVRRESLDAFAHQDLPFEKLVEELQPERDLSYNPLAQVMFVLLKGPMDRLELADLDVTPVEVETVASPYDIVLHMWETGDGLEGFWHYTSDLFDQSTMVRMMGHLETLLRAIATTPTTRVQDAPMLREAERHLMLTEWNATAHEFPDGACLHELFERRVALNPDAPAVFFGERSLTYGEVEAQANQLAHALRRRGVGPDMLVGLCVERSIHLVIGVLGILKAGGAYVPLDPAYPEERLRMMLDDSQTSILLTQTHLIPSLPHVNGEIIALDEAGQFAAEPTTRPESGVGARHLSYVIYTSGSTGMPKGIALEHRGVVNNIVDLNWRHGVGPGDRVLALSSLSFDMCVYEVLGTLEAGGAIVMPLPEEWREPGAWARLARRHHVSVWNSAPQLLKMLVDYVEDKPDLWPVDLHLTILGGDWVPVSLPDRLKAIAPKVRVIVLGGATEASIHSIIFPVEKTDPSWKSIPYGVPMWNQKSYILNASLQPVPVGVPGELFLGGIGLGRGYFQRPDQTAERFLPSPFVPGERIYRTGDLARYGADGVIELLGRIDYQVKLRGLRIECGEIESTVLQHPAVREIVVVAKDYAGGDKRLIGYVRPSEQAAAPLVKLLAMEKQGALRDIHTHDLPNGLVVVCHNNAETDFGYSEIFENDDLARLGVRLDDRSCVFDVGANIGLFSLKVHKQWPGARVFAFEPVGPVYDLLAKNLDLYDVNGKALNIGLAARAAMEEITYYPHLSLISSRFADTASDREVVKDYVIKQQHVEDDATLSAILADRLEPKRLQCEMKTLSQVIREQGVERIDLLKIDTERGELDVLAGIEDQDWQKIRQLVVEVYNREGDRVGFVTNLLARHGFRVVVEQHAVLSTSPFVNVCGLRDDVATEPTARVEPSHQEWARRDLLSEELREYARAKLPDYMVPTAFVFVPELPLSPNGKVDRKALVNQALTIANERVFVAPTGPIEETIARIFGDVLGAAQVGVNDNFFDLGGHSLLAAQVVAQVGKAFGLEVPLRRIFEAPTVAALAQTVEQATASGSEQALTAISVVPRTGDNVLSFAQEGLWFVHELVSKSTGAYNIAPGIRLKGPVDVAALERAVADLMARHEVLRSAFPQHDEHPVQAVGAVPAIPLLQDDLSGLSAAAQERESVRIAESEARFSFDLATGPLARARLVKFAAEDHLLTLTFHHIVMDGWSLDVVVRDLGALYNARLRGTPLDLPPLPVQFIDFATWERQWMPGHADRFVTFWKNTLAGAPPSLDLPADRTRPKEQTLRGARFHFRLPASVVERIEEAGRSLQASPFMVLLAAFNVFLSLQTDRDDIIVGSPFANRVHKETHDLIGPFVNTLPLRLRVPRDAAFRALIERARETVLAVEAHQSLPFDQIVAAVKPPRDLSRNAIFQVNFRVLVSAPFALELSGLDSTLTVSEVVTSKFDLALELCPAPSGMTAFFEYSTDLFDESTIRRMAGQFERLTTTLLGDPDRAIADVPVVRDLASARKPAAQPTKPDPATEPSIRGKRRRGVRVEE